MEKDILCKCKQKKAGVSLLISDQVDFKTKSIMKDKDRHYIIIKELIRGYGVHKHIYTQYRTMRASQVVLVVKNMPVNLGDTGLILGLWRSPGRGHGNPLQYSCLQNPLDREAWWAMVHRVTEFIRRTKAKAEAPIFWPPYAKSWLIEKDPDAINQMGWDVICRERNTCNQMGSFCSSLFFFF